MPRTKGSKNKEKEELVELKVESATTIKSNDISPDINDGVLKVPEKLYSDKDIEKAFSYWMSGNDPLVIAKAWGKFKRYLK